MSNSEPSRDSIKAHQNEVEFDDINPQNAQTGVRESAKWIDTSNSDGVINLSLGLKITQ